MELWQEDAKIPSLFNNLLYKRLLGLKIRLALHDFLCTTEWIVRRTVILACHLKPIFPEAMFNKNLMHALGLICKFRVIWWEIHLLKKFDAILHEPPILHVGLLPTRLKTHLGNQKHILGVCKVALWVIHQDEGLISGTMKTFKSGNYFLVKLNRNRWDKIKATVL